MTVSGIDIDVIHKQIKHIHIGVYPPVGRVRVAAPQRLDDDQIRRAVIQRLPWIRRQQKELEKTVRQSTREMVTGESHYVWGVRKRLKVVERPGRAHFEVEGDRLVLFTPAESTAEVRRSQLDRWYREQLRRELPALISKWESALGVSVPKWTIRRMKTKWGSCNRESRHLWFNVELAKKHPNSLEYIVVHEMTHYVDGTHGSRFIELMDERLPDWEMRRDDLNGAPLAEEEWNSK
ncbi:Putative predicted metal-dependent hydrolase [Leucobacter sp. 7(1)]|uniref:M48 family metallopeptidase n=1 Tax=Leucobacter sp. 7(1) TaxID=1255613 RepID=UPI00097EA97D|nr:SprT family zinc-dependent metalloprotease [Leucobacter sp. 7(1)]SJN10585.1 Putative predicted metal-dependent hydrolase [Leucobacter sp. 7(1)]